MKISAPGLQLDLSAASRFTSEDWCEVHVTVAVPGLNGRFEAPLQGQDLVRFMAEIERMYASLGAPVTATLASHEPGLEVVFTMQGGGEIAGRYRLESYRAEGGPTVLSGSFQIDQSYLPALSTGVSELLMELGATDEA